ncbi:hypothetical protein [Mesorhizobium sp. B2-3-4]|uniref:hypothetical protein n=1 Tax=Mesorhizobium sp. B2-3-4 TaxID=2589959 RepID=UPI00112935D2|nr:hypothetical protein [Mesorhizobium sp. B2-3-4]TPM40205.1 hypothetical protein FJ967_07740 [Mesorhizobium sp. B2-3-4]
MIEAMSAICASANTRFGIMGSGAWDETNKHSTHGENQVAHGSNTGHWSIWGEPGPGAGP